MLNTSRGNVSFISFFAISLLFFLIYFHIFSFSLISTIFLLGSFVSIFALLFCIFSFSIRLFHFQFRVQQSRTQSSARVLRNSAEADWLTSTFRTRCAHRQWNRPSRYKWLYGRANFFSCLAGEITLAPAATEPPKQCYKLRIAAVGRFDWLKLFLF